MEASPSANKINEIIKRAIAKQEITTAEFEEILTISDSDGFVDPQERAAIAHLREMIQDKTIKVKR